MYTLQSRAFKSYAFRALAGSTPRPVLVYSHKHKLRQRPERFTINRDHPLVKGLVFAGLGNLPGSKKAVDSSYYRNHGTLTNMAIPATATSGWKYVPKLGRWGWAFDGSNDFITCGSRVYPGDTITISAWVKRTWSSNTAYRSIATWNYNFGSDSGITFVASAAITVLDWVAGDILFFGKGSAATSYPRAIASHGTLVDGSWHLITGILGPAIAQLYLDGRPLAMRISAPAAVPATTGNFLIGSCATEDYQDGSMSDVGQWNRVLSPAEIRILANPSDPMLGGMLLPPKRKYFSFIPFHVGDASLTYRSIAGPSVGVAAASGGSTPYLWRITSQTLN